MAIALCAECTACDQSCQQYNNFKVEDCKLWHCRNVLRNKIFYSEK